MLKQKLQSEYFSKKEVIGLLRDNNSMKEIV